MPGFLKRLSGLFSEGEPAPPPFSLELPDGWVGDYGDSGWIDALVKHARAYPEDHDRAFAWQEILSGTRGLFVACTVRGPLASLIVTADDMTLNIDDELGAWVEGSLAALATNDPVVGEPIVSVLGEPYAGRELRYSEETEDGAFDGDLYAFATARRLWQLSFTALEVSPYSEALSRTIAASFRVVEPVDPHPQQ